MKGREVEEGRLYSPEVELQVLGCVLTDAKVAFTLLHTAEVTANFFYDLRHRELFRLLEEMFARGDEINLQTVHLRAKQKKLKCVEEGAAFLASLESLVPSVWSLPTFIDELRDQHHRRLALDVARRLT